MKTFANYSDLVKQTTNKLIYIELSNGYYIPVTKLQIKKVVDQMKKNDEKFCGEILEHSPSVYKISIAI